MTCPNCGGSTCAVTSRVAGDDPQEVYTDGGDSEIMYTVPNERYCFNEGMVVEVKI